MLVAYQRIARLLKGNAKYVVRLDDACETQDNAKWSTIEKILDRNDIKPLVAVVPCNEDLALLYENRDQGFWSRVKRWQEKGWVIGQHGFKHRRHKIEDGCAILPLHDESEFAGLRYDQQCALMRQGYEILRSHGVSPHVWVSPCHTYDRHTLKAIKAVTEIKIVSDGIACYPFTKYGLDFLPQQLWWPQWKLFGVWTICLHPSNMSAKEMARFEKDISAEKYRGRIIDPISALNEKRCRSYPSIFYRILFWARWYLRKSLKKMTAFHLKFG